MVGLLLLKQLENLRDKQVVLQCKRNPYYQAFCGQRKFPQKQLCHSTELVKFRSRIGTAGSKNIFKMSIFIHGHSALEGTVCSME